MQTLTPGMPEPCSSSSTAGRAARGWAHSCSELLLLAGLFVCTPFQQGEAGQRPGQELGSTEGCLHSTLKLLLLQGNYKIV